MEVEKVEERRKRKRTRTCPTASLAKGSRATKEKEKPVIRDKGFSPLHRLASLFLLFFIGDGGGGGRSHLPSR